MALSDATIQQMLIDECVTTSDAGVLTKVTNLMPNWWDFYSGKKQELRYWYARRALLMFLQAQARYWIDTKTGPDSVSSNQFFKNASSMLDYADKQITRLDPYVAIVTMGSIKARGSLPDTLHEQLDLLTKMLPLLDADRPDGTF